MKSLSSFLSACVSATPGTGVFVTWPMRTNWIHHRIPPMSLVLSWQNPLNSNDPIICATSLHCLGLHSWSSSWTLERCRVSKTKCFLVSVLPEFPSEDSCSCLFFRKQSYVSTPFILKLIGGLKNSQAHTKPSWGVIEILLCLRVCWSSYSLCPLLCEPFRWNFWPLNEEAQSQGTMRYLSLSDLYCHCPLACLLFSSG